MKEINRRDFVKMTGAAAVGFALSQIPGRGTAFAKAPVIGSIYVPKADGNGSAAKVYFTKHIDAGALMKIYDSINEGIYGKVAIKLHTASRTGRTFCRSLW